MVSWLQRALLRWLRVPAEPEPPPGDPTGIRTFLASHRYLRYLTAVWGLKQLAALSALLFWFFFLGSLPTGPAARWIAVGEVIAWITFAAQLPFSFALLRLDYSMRWYILSDRSLRIRAGIISVREQTMTFANVQNIAVQQNPLQRLFGIANVTVRAAGGGAGSSTNQGTGGPASGMHEAVFAGVDNAAEIRTIIRDRIRSYRDAGLGDPDDEAAEAHSRVAADAAPAAARSAATLPHTYGASANVLAAAQTLLAEVRALRAATR
jgi:uncharacterized membrane protein YdbT with pleckstrin-like domain